MTKVSTPQNILVDIFFKSQAIQRKGRLSITQLKKKQFIKEFFLFK